MHDSTRSNRRHGADQDDKPTRFRLGLFGDTRSGKTMYLTALYASGEDGLLPDDINLRPQPGASMKHLNVRLAMIRAGQWPPGDLDTTPILLLLDKCRRTFNLQTQDFRGGDFGNLAEPENLARFHAFIDNLFDGCSAYVFLIDPGVIKSAQESGAGDDDAVLRHRQRSRVDGPILAALEQLRPTGHFGYRFHKPVAIVFTKCDLHPDVAEDPAGFARRQLPNIWKYLADYVPHRHAFFAVSSTGPLPASDDPVPPPPVPLAPQGLLEPLLFGVDHHLRRSRLWRRVTISVLVLLLVFAYGWLFMANSSQINNLRERVQSTNDAKLAGLYQEATALSRRIRFLFTHPFERRSLPNEIAENARQRVKETIGKLCGEDGVLRSIEDFHTADILIDEFIKAYPGTVQAADSNSWLSKQRNAVSLRAANELKQFATNCNETGFNDLLRDYGDVATPEADKVVAEAWIILDTCRVRNRASRVFDARLRDPSNVDKILETLTEAEEELAGHPKAKKAVQVYLSEVRTLYGALDRNGTAFPVSFTISSPSDNKLVCRVWSNQEDKDSNAVSETDKGKPAQPLKNPDGSYELTSPQFQVDIIETRRLAIYVQEDSWGGDGYGRATLNLDAFIGSPSPTLTVSTNEGTSYTIKFKNNGGSIGKLRKQMAVIKKLEDKIFRGL